MLRFALGLNSHAVPHTGNSVKTLLMGVSTTIAAKNFVHFRYNTHTNLMYLLIEHLMQLSHTGKKVLNVNYW